MTVINKDSGTVGSDGRAANVTLNLPASYRIVSAQSISMSSSNVTDTTGITLGGSAINADGSHTPVWSQLAGSFQGNVLTVTVPPASATILKLTAGPVPSAPTGLTPTPLSDTQIALDWTSQTPDATAFAVEASTAGASSPP